MSRSAEHAAVAFRAPASAASRPDQKGSLNDS